MEEYFNFSKSDDFEEFFVNSLLYEIERDNNYLSTDYHKLGDKLFFKLREINSKVIRTLTEFTHSSNTLKLESLLQFIRGNNREDLYIKDKRILDNIYPLYISNLDKFVLIQNKQSTEMAINEITNYKLNIDVVYSHENMLKVDKAKGVLEIFTNNLTANADKNLNEQAIRERNLYELDLESLENLTTGLKELYANIN